MNAASLAGLWVVITRPEGQAQDLCQMLSAAGAEVTALPLIGIQPLTRPDQQARIRQQLATLAAFQHAIFISRNAAEQAWLAMQMADITWPPATQAYAVGSSTAAVLGQYGIHALSPARMDSEGLLALPAFQTAHGERCIIFRGEGGRETLAKGLQEQGLHVDCCELYRRKLPDEAESMWYNWRQALTQRNMHVNTPAVVLLNSVETLDNLLAVDKHCAAYADICWLVPSERVAKAALERGLHTVIVAKDALDETIVDTLQCWRRQQEHPLD